MNMSALESNLVATAEQFTLIDKTTRMFQLIRNQALCHGIDTKGAPKYDLNKSRATLIKAFDFANKITRQSAVKTTWTTVSRFFDNYKKNSVGKKGEPKFQKDNCLVEYKTTGWKASDDRRFLMITDVFVTEKLKLLGIRDLYTYGSVNP